MEDFHNFSEPSGRPIGENLEAYQPKIPSVRDLQATLDHVLDKVQRLNNSCQFTELLTVLCQDVLPITSKLAQLVNRS